MKKQTQIVLDSRGFFASRLQLESASVHARRDLKWKVFGDASAESVPAAEIAKQSQIGPVFKSFFSSGLALERSRRPLAPPEDDRQKPVGSFTWDILK